MEKFSKWRDAGTGIQPFLQPVPARSQQQGLKSLLNAAKNYLVGPLVALVRLAVLSVAGALDALTASAGALLIVPVVRRPWMRLTRLLWARVSLFALGFYRIDVRAVSLQKGRRATGNSATVKRAAVESGDIVVANHASYVDVLVLVAMYNPVFVEIDNATCRVRQVSMWQALRAPARQTPALLPAAEARSLKEITEMARVQRLGPVVVFAENATTNGRALLQLLPVFGEAENLDEKARIHVMAFRYPFESFSPAYSVGNQFAHVFQVCCQMYNSVTVRVLAEGEAPDVGDSAMLCDNDREPVDLDEAVQECLVGVSRLRVTRLTAMDKRDFLKFFYSQK
ncbi:Vacuolar protein sorting protein vps66 [Linderina macrospora]|uniref:Vacuolar protein sorting protein vps66 n=1 Tax=Linderina macrospora TaxID=4868 RepID=A0ACC1JH05_9FUNG|nr:Vacuolar protein sorting protein vps66 [Linderina macrospora]